jgi:hypothetical protein
MLDKVILAAFETDWDAVLGPHEGIGGFAWLTI